MATKKTAKKKPAKKAPKKTVKKAVKKAPKKAVKKIVKKVVKKPVKKAAAKAAPSPVQSPRLQEVQQLMEMMVAHGVTMLDLSDAKRSFILERGHVAPVAMGAAPAAAPVAAAPLAAPAAAAPAAEPEDDGLLEILSPMVGTFYTAPSPDSPAFAKTGDVIHGESVVCIVEAMKVMNEIKAELSGTIVEICVENAQPVEFGQVLFKVKA